MIRNLKVLGLGLVAVFAFSAMAASMASAAEQGLLTSTSGKAVTLDVTETGTGQNALTAFGEKVECPGTTYKGHEVGSTVNGVPNKGTTATITPTYNQAACVATPGPHKATIRTNGCDFVFHLGNTTPAGNKIGTYGVTADVVCPAGQSIIVDVYLAANNENVKVCEVTVGPQNGLAGPHATNTSSEDIDVTGAFTNIVASKSGLCGAANTNTAEFDIDATVTGTVGGVAEGITISD